MRICKRSFREIGRLIQTSDLFFFLMNSWRTDILKWYYKCKRGGICGKTCSENCFYTQSFFRSKLYRDLIKPSSVTFAKTVNGDWIEIDMDHRYPLPKMDPNNTHFTTTYNDLEQWVFSEAYKQACRDAGIIITYGDGSKKKL